MLLAVVFFRWRRTATNDVQRGTSVEVAPAANFARCWRKFFNRGDAVKNITASLDDAERIVLENLGQAVQIGAWV